MRKTQYKNIFLHQQTYWWYKGMQNINERLLQMYLPPKTNYKILDAGCGTGAAMHYLNKFGHVTGVDLSDEGLRYAKRFGPIKKADITKLPFRKNTFDVVVCLDVQYHQWVKSNITAFNELTRVLKPKGLLLIREPAFDWFKSSEDVVDLTKHRFTTTEIKKYLDKRYVLLKLTYANFILFPFAFIKRIPEVVGIRKKRYTSDIFSIPPLLNSILYYTFYIEGFLLRFIDFPFGTSVICLAKKK